MTEGSPDRQVLAWAAGLYDGEGSCSAYLPKKRQTYRRQMAVSQGGEVGQLPEVLTRFKSAVLDIGNITGPYRGYLYYWKTSRKDALDQIAGLLWPYLGDAKRSQFEAARTLARRGPEPANDPLRETPEIRLAWAAGFFDGEGTVRADDDPPNGRYPGINMEIPQSRPGGGPDGLVPFPQIVCVGN